MAVPRLGVAIAYQPDLRRFFEDHLEAVDFVEAVPDILWTDLGPGSTPRYVDDPDGTAFLRGLATARPVVLHSIGLSIGSAHRFNRDHIVQLARWYEWLQFPWHSDHFSYCLTALRLLGMQGFSADSAGHPPDVNLGITMPLPRDQETLDLLAPRIKEVQGAIPVPFLLENNVYFFDFADAEMTEAEFFNRLCALTGCGLLLDLHNIYVNCVNHDMDPLAIIGSLDLDRVVEIHVAGGMSYQGYYLDAHSGVLPGALWDLLDAVVPRCPNLGGIVFELFGPWYHGLGPERLRRELDRLSEVWHRHQPAPDRLVAL